MGFLGYRRTHATTFKCRDNASIFSTGFKAVLYLIHGHLSADSIVSRADPHGGRCRNIWRPLLF